MMSHRIQYKYLTIIFTQLVFFDIHLCFLYFFLSIHIIHFLQYIFWMTFNCIVNNLIVQLKMLLMLLLIVRCCSVEVIQRLQW